MPEFLDIKSNIGDLQKMCDELATVSLRAKELIDQILKYSVSFELLPKSGLSVDPETGHSSNQ